jgi:hypothetical protein
MNKKKLCTIAGIALLGCLCLAALVIGLIPLTAPPQTPVNVEQVIETVAYYSSMIESQPWPANAEGMEMLLPVEWEDQRGKKVLTLYNYRFQGLQESGVTGYPSLYEKIPDPATADDREECRVGEYPAVHYRSGKWAYLLWQPREDFILVFEYDPTVLARKDIFTIAESRPAAEDQAAVHSGVVSA